MRGRPFGRATVRWARAGRMTWRPVGLAAVRWRSTGSVPVRGWPVPAHPLARVHRRRLATQRLSSAGLRTGRTSCGCSAACRRRTRPLAAWSLGMRMRPARRMPACSPSRRPAAGCAPTCCGRRGTSLRPEDLRWMQRVTGPRVESAMAGVNARLGLDRRGRRPRPSRVLESLLAGPTPHTRREVRVAFDAAGSARRPCSSSRTC